MKIVGGVSLIAAAIALDVFAAPVGAALSAELFSATGILMGADTAALGVGIALGAGAVGADLLMSGISDALHLNNTGQSAFASHQPYKPWQIVYGRQRVNGVTIDMSLSDGGNGDNRWLWQAQVLAAHPVQNILATYLNQQQVFCNTSYTPSTGTKIKGTNGLVGNLIGSAAASGGNMDVNGMALEIHPFDLNFHEYDNFYWDGNPRFWMAQYNGLQTEADPFYIALCNQTGGAGTPHWTSECIVQNMAYSLNRYWANSNWATGAPQPRYDVQGKNNIFDPRTSTSGYSENAALVLTDYMCNQQYGMLYGISDFDSDTLIAAANICDETITLTNSQIIFNTTHATEPRYAINGTLSTSTDGGTVIEQMMGAMAGHISYIGGKWFIFPGAYQGTSGVALTETDLIGGIKWSPNRKARDLFNEVRALFTCPSGWDTTLAPGFDVYNVTAETVEDYFNGQWARIDMPPFCFNTLRGYSSDPYLTADNNVKYIQQVDFPYTISVAAAQRLAKIMLLRNRWQGTGTLTLPINYLSIQPNDIITMTYARFGWTNKQLEVQGTHINMGGVDENGNITAPSLAITVAEVDSSIYNWLPSDELKLQGGQSVAGTSSYTLSAPTSLILTSSDATAQITASGLYVPSILATWTSPSEAWITNGGKIVVQIAPSGSSAYQTVALLDGATTGYNIIGVSDGVIYNVNVYGITAQGAVSSGVTGSVTVAGGSSATLGYINLPDPVRRAIFDDGTVQNVGGTAATTVLAGVETANTALTNAAAAYAAANTANTLLATITGTTVLTPGQKPAIIADYNALVGAAWTANDAQAALVGVSSAAYDTALETLTTYLNTLTSPVAWNVTTNYTTINGTTFAANFEAAYAAQSALLNAIAAAINTISTSANSATMLQNPNFAAGDVGWTKQTGWSIVTPGSISSLAVPFAGSAYMGVHAGTTTSAITNNQLIQCAPGAVVSASSLAWAGANATPSGAAYIYINFFNASGTQLSRAQSTNAALTASVWQQLRVVSGPAPANTAYATVNFAVSGDTTGDNWYVSGFNASILPNSTDDIPQGSTNYFAVETGADKTLNHVLTTVAQHGTLAKYTAAEIQEVPNLSWDVIANDPSDVFNISALLAIAPTVNEIQQVQMLVLVDGNINNQYGMGFTAATYGSGPIAPGGFWATVTGLSAGTHTITLYCADYGTSAPTSENIGFAWGTLQQISS